MRLRPIIPLLFSLAIPSASTRADVVFGVTGSLGNGSANTNSIYRVDSNTAVETLIGATSVTGNAFAYNPSAGVYYYGSHSGTNLYSFNTSTGANTLLGNLTSYGQPAGTTLSGGADFYGGRYYYTPEVSDSNLYYVDFSADGTAIANGGHLAVTLPTGITGLGDFGDIAIDPGSGVLYGSSSQIPGAPDTSARFWRIDLNDPTYSLEILNTAPAVYQLAFDDSRRLMGNAWGTGNLYHLDTSDGSILSTTPTNFGGDFYDLATSGAAHAPEPSSTGLVMLGLLGGITRRRRRDFR